MQNTTTQSLNLSKADRYELVAPLLHALQKEFQEAARKKPEATLNKKKVQIANRLLQDVLEILAGEPSHAYIDLLDEDDLPQNSDVSLILGQAAAAMEAFKAKYYRWNGHSNAWDLKK